VAALLERQSGVGFLEVAGSDLGARDLGGQRQHRRHAAMRVVQAVDQVQVAGAAAARAGHEPVGQLCLRPSCERADLLMPHMYPIDAVVAADGVHHGVEAVPYNPVHAPHPGGEQDLDELVGDGPLCHGDLHGRARSGRETTVAWSGGAGAAAAVVADGGLRAFQERGGGLASPPTGSGTGVTPRLSRQSRISRHVRPARCGRGVVELALLHQGVAGGLGRGQEPNRLLAVKPKRLRLTRHRGATNVRDGGVGERPSWTCAVLGWRSSPR